MIFRQLFDTTSSTYTYLLADEEHREALLIDPVFSQAGRDLALINELGLKLVLVADRRPCHCGLAAEAENRMPHCLSQGHRR